MKKNLTFILAIFLLCLPFQRTFLPGIFRYIDEIFSVLFLLFAIFFVIYTLKIKRKILKISVVWLCFCVLGIISGIINQNKAEVTLLGLFDYLKNFVFVYALSMLSFGAGQIKRVYRMTSNLAVFICLISIFIVIAYLLGWKLPHYLGKVEEIRFGLPRVKPFQIHYNILGLYSLLFFILDFSIHPRLTFRKLLLLSGILFSVSRMVWLGFIIGVLFLIFQLKMRKRIVYGFLLLALSLVIMPKVIEITQREYLSEKYYRGYVLKKSFEIWRHSPLLGVGPGMYGGVVSVIFNSPTYEKYSFSKHWYEFGLANFFSLDVFWPQVLVECGLIGVLLFIYFLFLLYRLSNWQFKNSNIDFVKQFSLGLSLIPAVTFFYLFGSGLNLAPFLVTYSVFLGMCLGVRNLNEHSAYK